jgi:phosphonate transport system substrate-binding protein
MLVAINYFLGNDYSMIPENIIVEKDQMVITLGFVSNDEERYREEYFPLLDYLTDKLSKESEVTGKIIVADSYLEMAKLIKLGKVDLYIGSSFPSYSVHKLSGSEPLLIHWKDGIEKCTSVVFTKKDNAIDSTDDLLGKMIAFETPDSTAGYFLPKAELLKRGFNLVEKSSPSDFIGSNEIGYYFAGTKEQVTEDVSSGIAFAGGQKKIDVDTRKFKLLTESAEIYKSLISVRAEMDQNIKTEIRAILLNMHLVASGVHALSHAENTSQFTEFSPSFDEAFKGVIELSDFIDDELINSR